MYMIYQIFIMILKIDLFMLLAFSAQWLIMLTDEAALTGDYSQVIIHSVLSCGGSIVMMVLAYYGIKMESKVCMFVFGATIIATEGYFISKLVIMQPPYCTPGIPCTTTTTSTQCDRYDGYRNFFTLFLSLDILLGVVTLGIAMMATRNFGMGLKQHLTMQRRRTAQVGGMGGVGMGHGGVGIGEMEMSGQGGGVGGVPSNKRWTID